MSDVVLLCASVVIAAPIFVVAMMLKSIFSVMFDIKLQLGALIAETRRHNR